MVSPSIQNNPMRRIPALMTTPCGARITKCVFRIRKKVNVLRLHSSTAALPPPHRPELRAATARSDVRGSTRPR